MQMHILKVFTNIYLLVPAFSWLVAQILKTIITAFVTKKIYFSRLVGDGGMPSGHSATVTSLALMCGLYKGFDSVEFGISMILAIIVMHDALGVRRETGKQAESIINISKLLNDYFTEQDQQIKTDKLKVLVGHTPLQVVCGSLIGGAISIAYYLLDLLI